VLDGGAYVQPVAAPGSDIKAPLALSNFGSQSTAGVSLHVQLTEGLVVKQRYANCQYAADPESHWQYMNCDFAQPIAPGTEWQLPDGGFGLHVEPWAAAQMAFSGAIRPLGEPLQMPDVTFTPGTGGTLSLVQRTPQAQAVAADVDPADNYVDFDITVTNPIDRAAIGAALTASIGQQIDVQLGGRNTGPSALASFRSGGEYVMPFWVMVPSWATVTQVSSHCWALPIPGTGFEGGYGVPGGREYECRGFATYMSPGESETLPFRFQVNALTGTNGSVTTQYPYDPNVHFADSDGSNDTAAITVTGLKPLPQRSTYLPGGTKPILPPPGRTVTR
jgi:hypothetical protein